MQNKYSPRTRGRHLLLALRRRDAILAVLSGFFALGFCFAIIDFVVVGSPYTADRFKESAIEAFERQALLSGTPHSSTDQLLRFCQAVTANAYLAAVIGVLTFRLLRHPGNVVFPKRLAYNHLINAFEFRFWNRDAGDLSDAHIKAFVRKRIPRTQDRLVRDMMFPVSLTVDFEPYIESMMVIALRTVPPTDTGHDLRTETLNYITLDTLDADSSLIVTVFATSVDSGDAVVTRNVYRFEDIWIGSYRDTESDLEPTAFGNPKAWLHRDYSVFDTIDGPNVPAAEWRAKHGREGLASINIAGREHVLRYPDQGNASVHINNILEGRAYPAVDDIAFAATTVIDVGANVGAAAAYFRSKYPTCKLYCYEPDADNFHYLKRNLSGLQNVVLRPVALFSRRQDRVLFRGRSQCLQHSIYSSAEVTSVGEQIEMRPALGEVEPSITDYTLLKIDTEGCEYPILCSLEPVLNKISVIYLEFHSERDRQRIDELLGATHGLWIAKITGPHRGDLCYVHRKLYENNNEVQKWEIKSELDPSPPA